MEKVQEQRHVCKLCSKSFPCGRSLGGHMRSHAINGFQTIEKNPKTKLKSVNYYISDQNPNYTLRENPQKSSRFPDANEDDKLCNQCVRGFQSWKALFGHMKCHSDKLSNTINEDPNSLISANREFEMDSQLGNEIKVPRKKKKRSRRGQNRYKVSSEISSVSEIEQEQEEVALCLIMLSRDLRSGNRGFCSVSESSNNNFDLDEIGSSLRSTKDEKNKGKRSLSSLKFKKLRNGKLKSTISGSENSLLDVENKSDFGSEEKKGCVFKGEDERGFKSTEAQFRMKSIKRKVKQDRIEFCFEDFDINNKKRYLSEKISDGNCDNEKRIKFECTSCNKTFHSYQALGGHRASHKKFKGCFATKVENIENSIESRIIIEPNHESKTTPLDKDSVFFVPETNFASKKNKNKGHFECPICFKVFSSGQALGGHKRSHVIVGADSKINPTSVIRNQIPEVRDFLDLNLPAPTVGEEEENSGLKPWWVNSNDNAHETLIRLLLN